MDLELFFMSRLQRIEFEDAYYHVMNRGAGRRDIFDDDNDREQFLITVKEVHTQFGISVEAVLSNQKGRGRKNMPRKIAMYLGQKIGGYRLNEMAPFFSLRHYGGVSSAIYSVVEALKLDVVLSKKINAIINRLDP